MDFAHSPKTQDYLQRLQVFLAEHVALHKGSDYVVALLEASRKQGKYWQTLEAVLATQERWAINHAVEPRADVGLEGRVALFPRLAAQGEVLLLIEELVGLDLLLPRLRAAGKARVVNVASQLAGDLDLDDVQFERRPWSGRAAYAQSVPSSRSMASNGFASPFLDGDILSLVAENCPLVSP